MPKISLPKINWIIISILTKRLQKPKDKKIMARIKLTNIIGVGPKVAEKLKRLQ